MWRTQLALKPKPYSLHLGTIHHPFSKRSGIRTLLLPDSAVARGCRHILPDTPPTADLMLSGEQVVVQKLCAFRVWCTFENGACLGPGDKLAFGGDSGAGHVSGLVGGCKCCDSSAICGVQEGARGGGAANPAGVLRDEGI